MCLFSSSVSLLFLFFFAPVSWALINPLLRRERRGEEQDICKLAQDSQRATFNMEVRRYLQDIVVFLRLHRAVDGGVTPRATRQFEFLAR